MDIHLSPAYWIAICVVSAYLFFALKIPSKEEKEKAKLIEKHGKKMVESAIKKEPKIKMSDELINKYFKPDKIRNDVTTIKKRRAEWCYYIKDESGEPTLDSNGNMQYKMILIMLNGSIDKIIRP